MNIPMGLIEAAVLVAGPVVFTILGFVFVQLLRINSRLARIETHIGCRIEDND
jgi:hypothetical protein